jgi:hypothetical protein
MAKTEVLGENVDGGASSFRQSFDCEKKLMLLGLDAFRSGGFFAEVQELPNTAPEFGKLAVTGY